MEEKNKKSNITPETIEEFKKLFEEGIRRYNEQEYPNIAKLETELGGSWMFVSDIKKILELFDDNETIYNKIEKMIKVYGVWELKFSDEISSDCFEVFLAEYKKTESFSMENFANKYPEYFEQLRNAFEHDKMIYCEGIQYYVNSEKYRELIKALLPSDISEEDIDKKMDVIMFYYVRKQLKNTSDKSKETIITFFSEHFKPNLVLHAQKVGFTDVELEFVKNTIKFFDENPDEIPDDMLDNFFEWLNGHEELDIQKILKSGKFEDFKNFNNFFGYSIRYCIQDDIFDENDIEKINKLLKVTANFSLEQLNQLNCLEDIIIVFTNMYKKYAKSNEEKGNTSKELFNTINGIFEIFLKECNDPKDLLNDIPSRCIQLMNSEFLPDNYREKLIETYNINYKNRLEEKNNQRINEIITQNPTIIEKIEKRENLTDEEYEIFEELACLDRANNGIFKENYIDYIIKREVETGFLLDNQKENLTKRLIEDKSTYILRDNGLQNYHISIVEQQYLSSKDTIGDHNSFFNEIRFSKDYVCKIPIMNNIITMFHEIQHAIQDKEINSVNSRQKTDFLIYDMLKDKFLVSIYGKDFYDTNYRHIKCEVDARIAANIKLMQYLQSIGVEDKRIVDLIQDLNINQEIKKDSQMQKESLRKVRKEKDSKIMELVTTSDYLFQQNILKYPKILEKIQPALLEFNGENGKRKGNISILQDYNNWCIENNFGEEQIILDEFGGDAEKTKYYGQEEKSEEIRTAELFVHIINNDAIVPNDEIINDMMLLSSLDSSSKKISKLRDLIIKKDILPRIEYWIEQGRIPTELDMQSIEAGISSLENFAMSIDDKELSESILKKINAFRSKSFEVTDKLNLKEELENLQKIFGNVTSREIIEGQNAIRKIANPERSGVESGRSEFKK